MNLIEIIKQKLDKKNEIPVLFYEEYTQRVDKSLDSSFVHKKEILQEIYERRYNYTLYNNASPFLGHKELLDELETNNWEYLRLSSFRVETYDIYIFSNDDFNDFLGFILIEL